MIRRLLPVLIGLTVAACIEPIEFSTRNEDQWLVVEGLITPNSPSQSVRLSYTSPFGTFREPANASQVLLIDANGASFQYSLADDDPGRYVLATPHSFITAGQSYSVEIRMADGRIYRSIPETIPPLVQADSLSFDVSVERFTTEEGGLQERAFLNLRLSTPLAQNQYLRWTGTEVYSFVDIACGGLDPSATCYYNKGALNPQEILLYTAPGNTAGYLDRYPLTSRLLQPTYEFEGRHCFNVYQQSITPQAYAYWEDIGLILSADGSLFAAPPAAVRGNVYNVDDETETVLGYVTGASVDTIRLFTSPPEIRNYIPFPSYCPGRTFNSVSPDDPAACCFCTALETSDELIPQPAYW